MINFKLYLSACFSGLMISCDVPNCTNTNPVFDNNTPGTKAYNEELLKQLSIRDNDDVIYTLVKYEETEGKEMLHIKVQDDSLCATAVMTMINWGKLEDIQRTKGNGYINAELDNLSFDIYRDNDKTELLFKDADGIID